ncbi:MAG: VOC family protein [Acidobacteriota bacterium]
MTIVLGLDHVQLAQPEGGEDQGRAFYGELLGLEELPKPEPLAGRGGLWFRCGSLQLHLGVEKDFRPAKKAHPCLIVGDLDAVVARLSEAGHEAKEGEVLEGRRRAFTADPFGNRIELMEPLKG